MYTPHGNPLKRVEDKRREREREREIFNEVETTAYTVPLLGSFFKKGTRPTPPCLEFHPPDLFRADKVDRSRQCLRLYARPRNESLVSNAIFPTFHSVHIYICASNWESRCFVHFRHRLSRFSYYIEERKRDLLFFIYICITFREARHWKLLIAREDDVELSPSTTGWSNFSTWNTFGGRVK